MFGILKRFLKDKKFSIIAFTLGAMATVEMYLALFPTLKEQSDQLNQLLEAYPKGLMEAFGFESAANFFSRIETYMSSEYFSFFWPILAIILVIGFANHLFAAEVENGSIELALAQPISRIKLFLSRYLAGALGFLIFSLISVYAIVLSAIVHHFDYQLANYFSIWGMGFLFGMAVYSLACFFSVLFAEKGKATFATAGLLLAMYVVNIISSFKESLDKLKYGSFFHYFNPPQVLGKNQIVDWSILVFVGVIVIFTAGTMLLISKKDITT